MNNSPYLSLFLQEMRDNCAGMNQKLVALEKKPTDAGLIAEIMRLSHSCKGAAATMGFEKTAEFCHAMEDVFDAVRKGGLVVTPAVIDVCLQGIDTVDACLTQIEKDGKELTEFAALSPLQVILRANANASPSPATPVAAEVTDQLQDIDRMSQVPHIRVESKKLDTLLELAGELSVLRLQFSSAAKDSSQNAVFLPLLDRFARLADDLTYQVTQSRLIPLDQVFARFPRLVRDLSRSQGKQIEFVMEGTGIDLDKTLVDHLTTPLIHLLRNAVDHGIESPEIRKKKGKSAQATIAVRVRREQGYAVITVEDDGQQIELSEIKRIAAERGFTAEEIAEIRQETLLDFLCNARFSSTKNISMVSGRGVGLSAVRDTVKELGGHLRLEQDAAGKRFILLLPLQLSVIRAIMVNVQGSTYGLPFVHIRRLLQVTPADIRTSLEQEVTVIDGEDVPVLRLGRVFAPKAKPAAAEELLHLLLTDTGEGTVALCVDAVIGNEEVMVKPVSETLHTGHYFSGHTVLADGKVALIVDIPALVHHHRGSASSKEFSR